MPASAPIKPTTVTGWTARLGRGLAAAVFVVFAVVAVAKMQSGTHGDPRTMNPSPGPAPYPPLLGIGNWPLITSKFVVIMTGGSFGAAAWLSVRQR